MTEVIKNVGFNRIDLLNVTVSANDIKELTDTEINVVGVLMYTTPDKETGEVKTVGAVKLDNDMIYGFTSATLLECSAMMIEVLTESDVASIKCRVTAKESKSKRTFYQFVVTDIVLK